MSGHYVDDEERAREAVNSILSLGDDSLNARHSKPQVKVPSNSEFGIVAIVPVVIHICVLPVELL